ncbi:Uncharacterised protein [Klebsiella pneumoniae]|nr:Uncharacterised protein [Klebsiella pneumoniae]
MLLIERQAELFTYKRPDHQRVRRRGQRRADDGDIQTQIQQRFVEHLHIPLHQRQLNPRPVGAQPAQEPRQFTVVHRAGDIPQMQPPLLAPRGALGVQHRLIGHFQRQPRLV